MVKPTFLCIGVQKSGTESLINYLNQHPEIFMKRQELHFFDTKNLTDSGIIQYEKQFDTDKLIVGEKTPSYNYLQFAIDRIYTYNPNIKLILILREPISRAFSQYNMTLSFMKKSLNDVSDEQIIADFEKEEGVQLSEIQENGNYYIARGKYDEILMHIFSKFKRENIYIGIAEEIKENKQTYYNDIFKFLGATEMININEDVDAHIRNYDRPIPNILEKKLYDIFRPHNERLYEILGRRIDSWEAYYHQITDSSIADQYSDIPLGKRR
jgi:hypothetical protein